jgi:Phycobilisome protein
MLSQMQRLSLEAEGRYATDEELKFIPEYLKTYELRLQTYQKLQEIEATVIQQVYEKVQAKDPATFRNGNVDLSAKCKRDALMTWRYSAMTLLIDDQETLRERYLLWYQTMTRSCSGNGKSSAVYSMMQEVVKQYLTPPQSALINPILELSRRMLSV